VDWVQWLGLAGGLAALATFVWGRRDASRSDAAAVYVVVTTFQPAPLPPGEAVFTRYQIVNDGDLPVLIVAVEAWDWGRRRITWRLRREEHWMTGRRIIERVYNTVTPHTSTDEDQVPGLAGIGPPGVNPPILLRFCDGHGRRWVRWPDGKLARDAPSLSRVEAVWRRRRARVK
jgi:hypothetical protein